MKPRRHLVSHAASSLPTAELGVYHPGVFPLKMDCGWVVRISGITSCLSLLALAAFLLPTAHAGAPDDPYRDLKPEALRDALEQRRQRMSMEEVVAPHPIHDPLAERAPEFLAAYNLWYLAQGPHQDSHPEVEEALHREANSLAIDLKKIVTNMTDKRLKELALLERKFSMAHTLQDAFVERSIEQEVARILKEPRRTLSFPPEPLDLPFPYMSQADAALVAERKEYTRAMAPFALLATERARKNRTYEKDSGAWKLEQAFWRGESKGIAEQTLEFHFEGENDVITPDGDSWDNRRLILSFLRERKMAEALGASLLVSVGPRWLRIRGRPYESWRFDLARYCGFDPETLMIGSDHNGDRFDLLAANGSAKGARALMTVFETWPAGGRSVSPGDWRQLANFLPPGPAAADPLQDVRSKIPQELQVEILQFLAKSIGSNVPFVELEENLAIFAELLRPETKPFLREILLRPSRTFAEKSAVILRAMGENVPKIKPALPVRLLFTLNDKRLVLENLGTVKTDEEGFAELPRDFFFDPATSRQEFVFWQNPGRQFLQDDNKYTIPFLAASKPALDRLGDLVKINFQTCELPIEIDYPRPPSPKVSGMLVTLSRADNGAANRNPFENLYTVLRSKEAPFPNRFHFTTLSPGRYQISVRAPGAAKFTSEPIEVRPEMPTYRVRLDPGADLYASIYVPGNAAWGYNLELWRDGTNITYQYQAERSDPFGHGPLFVGLPKGKYELISPSSKDLMLRSDEPKTPVKRPEEPRKWVYVDGLKRSFTVDETTPPFLDLGRIDISAVETEREKAAPPRQIIFGLEDEQSPGKAK